MSKDVKMIAALMDDDLQGENLLDAARNLCAAFYDLLKAAEPETKEVILLVICTFCNNFMYVRFFLVNKMKTK